MRRRRSERSGLQPPTVAQLCSRGHVRLRARAEDRIRTLRHTGLTNLPLQAFGKNEVWLELAPWTQLLAWPDHPARS